MAVTSGILSPERNFDDRLVRSLEEMTRRRSPT